jgi:hypothetical protein
MGAYAGDWAVYVCDEHCGNRLREGFAAQWPTVHGPDRARPDHRSADRDDWLDGQGTHGHVG